MSIRPRPVISRWASPTAAVCRWAPGSASASAVPRHADRRTAIKSGEWPRPRPATLNGDHPRLSGRAADATRRPARSVVMQEELSCWACWARPMYSNGVRLRSDKVQPNPPGLNRLTTPAYPPGGGRRRSGPGCCALSLPHERAVPSTRCEVSIPARARGSPRLRAPLLNGWRPRSVRLISGPGGRARMALRTGSTRTRPPSPRPRGPSP